MPGVFSFVQRFFESLFGGSSPDSDKRRLLREIAGRLKSHKPPYYDPSTDEVLPGFASVVGKLSMAVTTVAHVLDRTILADDVHYRDRCWDYLIEAHIPGDLLESRRVFGYERMRQRIMSSADQASEMTRLRAELEDFATRFSPAHYRQLEESLQQLHRLGSLCRFDFSKLLRPFGDRPDSGAGRRCPTFKPASAELVSGALLDFYFLAAGLRIGSPVSEHVYLLLERILGEKAKSHRDRLRKTPLWIQGALERYLAKPVLKDLIRVVRGDPGYSPKVDRSAPSFLGEYRKRVQDRFDLDLERIKREADEALISMDLSILFKRKELASVAGYNEENNRSLLRHDVKGFTETVPLQIVKSFLVLRFEQDYKPIIKRLLVDGYFEDRGFQTSLSGALYDCEKGLQAIEDFEKEMTAGGKTSVAEAKRLLALHRQGKAALSALNGLVDAIDDSAKEMIERATGAFFRLYSLLDALMNDLKSRSPMLISNIKVLAGSRNNELIKLMLDMQNDLDKFLEIMKRFTFVGPSAVPAQKVEE